METISIFNQKNFSQEKFIEYVKKKNTLPPFNANEKAKIAFLIDATISMDVILGKIKLMLPEIFSSTYETLKAKEMEKTGL